MQNKQQQCRTDAELKATHDLMVMISTVQSAERVAVIEGLTVQLTKRLFGGNLGSAELDKRESC